MCQVKQLTAGKSGTMLATRWGMNDKYELQTALQNEPSPTEPEPSIPEPAPTEPNPYPITDPIPEPNPEPNPFPAPPEPIPQFPPDVTFLL